MGFSAATHRSQVCFYPPILPGNRTLLIRLGIVALAAFPLQADAEIILGAAGRYAFARRCRGRRACGGIRS
jgi:hypothetical protein